MNIKLSNGDSQFDRSGDQSELQRLLVPQRHAQRLSEDFAVPSEYLAVFKSIIESADRVPGTPKLKDPGSLIREIYEVLPDAARIGLLVKSAEITASDLPWFKDILRLLNDLGFSEDLNKILAQGNHQLDPPLSASPTGTLSSRVLTTLFKHDHTRTRSIRIGLALFACLAGDCPAVKIRYGPYQPIKIRPTSLDEVLPDWAPTNLSEANGLPLLHRDWLDATNPLQNNAPYKSGKPWRADQGGLPGDGKTLLGLEEIDPEQRKVLLYLARQTNFELCQRDWNVLFNSLEQSVFVDDLARAFGEINELAMRNALEPQELFRASLRLLHNTEQYVDYVPAESRLFPARLSESARVIVEAMVDEPVRDAYALDRAVADDPPAMRILALRNALDLHWPAVIPHPSIHTDERGTLPAQGGLDKFLATYLYADDTIGRAPRWDITEPPHQIEELLRIFDRSASTDYTAAEILAICKTGRVALTVVAKVLSRLKEGTITDELSEIYDQEELSLSPLRHNMLRKTLHGMQELRRSKEGTLLDLTLRLLACVEDRKSPGLILRKSLRVFGCGDVGPINLDGLESWPLTDMSSQACRALFAGPYKRCSDKDRGYIRERLLRRAEYLGIAPNDLLCLTLEVLFYCRTRNTTDESPFKGSLGYSLKEDLQVGLDIVRVIAAKRKTTTYPEIHSDIRALLDVENKTQLTPARFFRLCKHIPAAELWPVLVKTVRRPESSATSLNVLLVRDNSGGYHQPELIAMLANKTDLLPNRREAEALFAAVDTIGGTLADIVRIGRALKEVGLWGEFRKYLSARVERGEPEKLIPSRKRNAPSVEGALIEGLLTDSGSHSTVMPLVSALLAEISDDDSRKEALNFIVGGDSAFSAQMSRKMRGEPLVPPQWVFATMAQDPFRQLSFDELNVAFKALAAGYQKGGFQDAVTQVQRWCAENPKVEPVCVWTFLLRLSADSANWETPLSIFSQDSPERRQNVLALFAEISAFTHRGGSYSGTAGKPKFAKKLLAEVNQFFLAGGISESAFDEFPELRKKNNALRNLTLELLLERTISSVGPYGGKDYPTQLRAAWASCDGVDLFFGSAIAATILNRQRERDLETAMLSLPQYLVNPLVRATPNVFAALVRQLIDLRDQPLALPDVNMGGIRRASAWADTAACMRTALSFMETFGPRIAPLSATLYVLVENQIPEHLWHHYLGYSPADLMFPAGVANVPQLISVLSQRRARLCARYHKFTELPGSLNVLERELLRLAIGQDVLEFPGYLPEIQRRLESAVTTIRNDGIKRFLPRPFSTEELTRFQSTAYYWRTAARDDSLERLQMAYVLEDLLTEPAVSRRNVLQAGELSLSDLGAQYTETEIINVKEKIARQVDPRSLEEIEALSSDTEKLVDNPPQRDVATSALRAAIQNVLDEELSQKRSLLSNVKPDSKSYIHLVARCKRLEFLIARCTLVSFTRILLYLHRHPELFNDVSVRQQAQALLMSAHPPSQRNPLSTDSSLARISRLAKEAQDAWESELKRGASPATRPRVLARLSKICKYTFRGALRDSVTEILSGKPGNTEYSLQLVFGQEIDLRLLGVISDTCAVQELQPQQTRPNMGCIVFQCPDAPFNEPIYRGGTGIIATIGVDSDGNEHRCLLIRGFNPSEFELRRASAESLFERFLDSLTSKAYEAGFSHILIPSPRSRNFTLTNRLEIESYTQRHYEDNPKTPKMSLKFPEAAVYNSLPIDSPCLIVRQRPASSSFS